MDQAHDLAHHALSHFYPDFDVVPYADPSGSAIELICDQILTRQATVALAAVDDSSADVETLFGHCVRL